MKSFNAVVHMAALGVLMGLFGSAGAQQDYPNKPIRIVVAFPPGGATDVVARVLGQRLSERVKQPVIVENRAGASGVIGTEYTAKAAPDGYTLTFTANSHLIRPHLLKVLRYDVKKDFSAVAMVGGVPNAFIAKKALPVNTIAEFVQYAREHAGKLSYGSWGVGSAPHVRVEMFKLEHKLDLLHVPYQGAAPALTAVVGGQIDMMMIPLLVAEGQYKAGRIRMLGVSTAQRIPEAPDVLTFSEQGMPLTGASWLGFLGPANIPAEIVNLLNREITAMVKEPQMHEALAKNGVEVSTSTAQEFTAYLDAEYEFWGKAIRTVDIPKE